VILANFSYVLNWKIIWDYLAILKKKNLNKFSENAGSSLSGAQKLIEMSEINAMSSTITFIDKYPMIEPIVKAQGTDSWDFFMTVAGVKVGLLNFESNHKRKELHELLAGLEEHFPKWNPNALAAYDDLITFIQKNVSGGIDELTAIGIWVLWNQKQEAPSPEETSIAPSIGRFLNDCLDCWWN